MKILDILQQKSDDVETLRIGQSVGVAMKILIDKGVGAVVVCNSNGGVVGILSERDIIRIITRKGPAAVGQEVSEAMTSKVISCSPDNTVKEVMAVMTQKRFRHMPVISNGKLIGVISIGDVVKSQLTDRDLEVNVVRDFLQAS
ncbi:MAG: CBS domain-containing protein [Rhodospirillales bacterium]